MKTSPTSIALLAITALALPSLTRAESDQAPKDLRESIRVDRYVEPTFPISLTNKSVAEGYAQVQVLVAADGALLECFVSSYSRIEFADAVEAAMRRTTFRPAADPTALPQRFNLRFNFRREGMIVIQGDFQETVNAYLGQTERVRRETEVALCKLRDLDNIPEPVNFVAPEYPADLMKQKIEGGAAVSFFIDEEGRVRVASVAGATRPEFGRAAVNAVKQWTFAPPMRKGQATRVFAVQEFTFTPDKAAPAKAAAATN